MMKLTKYLIFSLILFCLSCNQEVKEEQVTDQKLSPAQQLLKQCISYHDPKSNWASFSASINSSMSLFKWDAEKEDTVTTMRSTDILMNNAISYLEVQRMTDGYKLKRTVLGDSICESTWEKPEISPEDSIKLNLNCESTKRYRNYYRYMLGLPMVLNDKAAMVKNKVTEEEVNGLMCKVLTVNYEPIAKEPTWYFYINPSTFQLVRAKFIKPAEEGKDPVGEIIDFPAVSEFQGMKMLSTYKWLLLDGERLGDDIYTFRAL